MVSSIMINQTLILDIEPQAATHIDGDDPLVYEKQFIYVGSFKKNDPVTGELLLEFSVDESDIDHWVEQHNKLLEAGLDVPMPIGHNEDPLKRAATALSYEKRKDDKGRQSLFVKHRYKTAKLAEDLKDTQVSLFCPREFTHNDVKFHRPIRHIAFTDYPTVPDLGPTVIAASSEGTITKRRMKMDPKELAASLGITITNEADEAIIGLIKTFVANLQKTISDLTAKIATFPDIAASTDMKKMLDTAVTDNRKLKIDRLFIDRRITAAKAKELKTKWAEGDLVLSSESSSAFDSIIDVLSDLPQSKLGAEQTGGQRTANNDSSLVSAAKKRAAQVAK